METIRDIRSDLGARSTSNDSGKMKRFHPSMMEPGDISLSIGKPKTGKTVAVYEILFQTRRDVPHVIVMCPTVDAPTNLYKHIVPGIFLHDNYKPELLAEIITKRTLDADERHERGLQPRRIKLVVDDCGWQKKNFCNDAQLLRAVMTHRHAGLEMHVMVQFPLAFHPEVRNCFDWIFLHRELFPSNRRRLYEHYAESIGSYARFCKVLDKCTERKGGVLVIRNTGTSTNWRDNFFWWQPPLRDWHVNTKQRPWHCCNKSAWATNYRHYNDEWKKSAAAAAAAGTATTAKSRAR